MKIKASKKIIMAALALLMAVGLAAGSTFAWFSMNNKVTVTGMSVKTKVANNLFIADSTASNDKVADSAFQTGLNQTVSGTLQPTSTIKATPTSFYYTDDAQANGSKQTAAETVPYSLVEGNDIVIDAAHYKAYVDYVFELKAVNADSAARTLNLNKLNLLYQGAATNVTHAFRVAIFSQDQADPDADLATTAVSDAYAAISTTSADAIFAPSDFAYFDSKAVSGTTTKAAVSPTVNGAKWTKTISAGDTQYFKVTVRLWLEGEDTDCYNAKFVDLTRDWTLDIGFSLNDDNTSGVQAIGSTAGATNILSTNTFTATLTAENEVAQSYQWYKVGSPDTTVGTDSNTYTADATGSYYCKITTQKGTVYYTPVVGYLAS